MSVLGEKVKGDCQVSFSNSAIFSYSVIRNSFEFYFFFCIFWRTTRANLEDHRWSTDHSLRNAGVNHFFILLGVGASRLKTRRNLLCTPIMNCISPYYSTICASSCGDAEVHNQTPVPSFGCNRKHAKLFEFSFQMAPSVYYIPGEPSRARLLTALTVTDSYVTTLLQMSLLTEMHTYTTFLNLPNIWFLASINVKRICIPYII